MKGYSRVLILILLLSVADVISAQTSQDNSSSQNAALSALIKDALERENAGDLIGAIEANKKVLQIEPKNVAALNTIAGLYGKLGKFGEEIVWAKKAISANPQFALAPGRYVLVLKGQAYDFTVAGTITEAAQCLERFEAASSVTASSEATSYCRSNSSDPASSVSPCGDRWPKRVSIFRRNSSESAYLFREAPVNL